MNRCFPNTKQGSALDDSDDLSYGAIVNLKFVKLKLEPLFRESHRNDENMTGNYLLRKADPDILLS